MSEVSVRITGLAEFSRNLKKLDSDLPKALRVAMNDAANVVVDAATRDKLLAAGMSVVRDESGRVLGRFIREEEVAADFSDHGLSDEELSRRLAADATTYTTAEVLAHLRPM